VSKGALSSHRPVSNWRANLALWQHSWQPPHWKSADQQRQATSTASLWSQLSNYLFVLGHIQLRHVR
jgi:hypothetical protein